MTRMSKLTFIDPKNDVAFKKLFGDENHADILLEFLNEVLELDTPILEVRILNPYQLPRTKGLKLTALDIRARDKNHEFLIEMQVEKQKWFRQRVMHYVCKAYSSQLKKGDNYARLKPVVFLGILNFREFEGNHIITRHKHINHQTSKNELRQVELNFIELPNFTKEESKLTTLTDQWLYFLKNAEKLDHVPSSVTSERLREAYETMNEHSWTEEELQAYDYWTTKEHARENSIETARLEGLEEGMEKSRLDIVTKMLKQRLDITLISQVTGLSQQEVEQLKQV